jgi:protein-S-isoprenylcysteine O-methyltransferase Ste14
VAAASLLHRSAAAVSRARQAQANAVSILVLTVLPVTVYLWWIRVEEVALAQGLGDRYQTFAAGRARLVPWLY